MGSVSFDFEGETAVVTGGSSGIGRAAARRLAGAGAAVVVADVREEPRDGGRPTHEAIEAAGGTAEYVETDVSEFDDLAAAVEAARAFGGVDVMVNNAGIYVPGTVQEATAEEFDRSMAVNARGVLLGCRLAAEEMVERGGGAIVNAASIRSTMAAPEHVYYDASKAAVLMITRDAAVEFADAGIRVNAVAPGYIATAFNARPEEVERAVESGETLKPVPQGRAGTPGEVADAVAYLASDAAGYVTGEALYVDGGYAAI